MYVSNKDIIVYFICITAILLALLFFIGLIIFQSKKVVSNLISEHEKKLMAARLEIQELTFQNIAYEIHDNISNSLILSKAHLDALDFNYLEDAKVKVQNSSVLIDNSIESLRNIAQSLSSNTIKQLGLVDTLRSEVHKINTSGILVVRSDFSGPVRRLSLEKEVQIFRIVQEAFSNIIKHSRAKVVDIGLSYQSNYLALMISDDGVGFDQAVVKEHSRGSGLSNIQVRAEMMNGHLEIASEVGGGTRVHVLVPYGGAH